MRALLILPVAAVAVACTSASSLAPSTSAGAAADPSLEQLYSARIEPAGLRLRAASNGCTRDGVELYYPLDAIGVPSGAQVTVLNPVGRPPQRL